MATKKRVFSSVKMNKENSRNNVGKMPPPQRIDSKKNKPEKYKKFYIDLENSIGTDTVTEE